MPGSISKANFKYRVRSEAQDFIYNPAAQRLFHMSTTAARGDRDINPGAYSQSAYNNYSFFIKTIVPLLPDGSPYIKGIQEAVIKATNKALLISNRKAVQAFKGTVATWKKKPTFKSKLSPVGGKADPFHRVGYVYIHPEIPTNNSSYDPITKRQTSNISKIYYWVDKGTNRHTIEPREIAAARAAKRSSDASIKASKRSIPRYSPAMGITKEAYNIKHGIVAPTPSSKVIPSNNDNKKRTPMLYFHVPYRSKTMPGFVGSIPGGAGKDSAAAHKVNNEITARSFSTQIAAWTQQYFELQAKQYIMMSCQYVVEKAMKNPTQKAGK